MNEFVQQVKTRAVPAARAAVNSDEVKRVASSLRELWVAIVACVMAVAHFLEPAAARAVSCASAKLKVREDAAQGTEATVFRGLRCAMGGVDRAAKAASGVHDSYDGPCKEAVRCSSGAFAGAVGWLREPPQDAERADRVVHMAPRPLMTVRAAAEAPESAQLRRASTSLFWSLYAAIVALVIVLAPAAAGLIGRAVAYIDQRRAVAGNFETRALGAVTSASKAMCSSGDAAIRMSSSYSGPGNQTVRSMATAHKSFMTWLAEAANGTEPTDSATGSASETVRSEPASPPTMPAPPRYVAEMKSELEKKIE